MSALSHGGHRQRVAAVCVGVVRQHVDGVRPAVFEDVGGIVDRVGGRIGTSHLILDRTDVGAIASGGVSNRRIVAGPRQTALIGRRSAAVALVDGDAAGQQSMRRRRPAVVQQRPEVNIGVIHADLIAGVRRDDWVGRPHGAEVADDVVADAGERPVEVGEIGAEVAGDDGVAKSRRSEVADAAGEVGEAAVVRRDRAVGDVRSARIDQDGTCMVRGMVAADRAVGHVERRAVGQPDRAAVAIAGETVGDRHVVEIERRVVHQDRAAPAVSGSVGDRQIVQRDLDARISVARIDVEDPVERCRVDDRAIGMAGDGERLPDVEVAGQPEVFVCPGESESDRAGKIKHDRVRAAASLALRIGRRVVVRVDDRLAQRAVIDRGRASQAVLRPFDVNLNCAERHGESERSR